MSVRTVLENRDAREGSRSAFPTKMEVTTVDERFAMVEGFEPFFRAIANILNTVVVRRYLCFGLSPRKRRISFGDKVPTRQPFLRLRLVAAVSPRLSSRTLLQVPLPPRRRTIETQLRCDDHRPIFNCSYFTYLPRTFTIPQIRAKTDLWSLLVPLNPPHQSFARSNTPLRTPFSSCCACRSAPTGVSDILPAVYTQGLVKLVNGKDRRVRRAADFTGNERRSVEGTFKLKQRP